MDSMEKKPVPNAQSICMHHVNVDDGDGDSKSDGEGAGS